MVKIIEANVTNERLEKQIKLIKSKAEQMEKKCYFDKQKLEVIVAIVDPKKSVRNRFSLIYIDNNDDKKEELFYGPMTDVVDVLKAMTTACKTYRDTMHSVGGIKSWKKKN